MVQIIERKFWLKTIEKFWKRTNLIWLYGVRRSGKTYLTKSLKKVEYFDCELPRVRRFFDDPEEFFGKLKNKKIVIDEIHRLNNPSEILKIATDYFPSVKIIATGSSTLGSSAKFKDTLVGRKKDLWLLPMMSQDLADFKSADLKYRFFRGGLPPFFLASEFPEADFQDWLDAFWSKDISELFRLERRYSFQKFMELIFSQSGGIFEASSFAAPCEVSRTTISNYLKVLEATSVAFVVRPYSTHKSSEIVSAPKVYAFDTGFVCYFKGWDKIRRDDHGFLAEHFVLNELYAQLQSKKVFYWRDKRGHEVDFVLVRGDFSTAIEVKWQAKSFDPKNILSFRRSYPRGKNYAVCFDVDREFSRKFDGIRVEYVSLSKLIDLI